MIHAVPLLLLAALLVAVPNRAEGCAAVGPEGGRVDITAETAMVVWDEATKTQHFIRRGSFRSSNYDFGFLVPTPTKPELDVADERVFEQFASLTAPKVETRTSYELRFGCFAMSAKTASDVTGGVMVLEQKKVGDYDAAVLGFKGDDAKTGAVEVRRWLEAHGYPSPPWLDAWLTPYVEQKWLVTAFKIGKPNPDAGPKDPSRKHNLSSHPIRMSFKTERPFYPYREPEQMRDEAAGGVPRSLRVYFVGSQRFAGKIGGDGAWPARTVWANKLGEQDRAALTDAVKLPAGLPAGELWLTEFEDHSRPRPGTDEVYFEPSRDQATVARPPIIRTVYDRTPWLLGGLAGAAVGIGFMWWTMRRK